MARDIVRRTTRVAHGGSFPRKVRTADCRNCLLRKSLVDARVSPPTVRAICDRMWLNRVRRRQILSTEGNRCTHVFAIRSGKVKLVRVNTAGRESVVGILESGDLFGLEALFDRAYATGAEALTDCELCSASGGELAALMADVPRVAIDLVRYLHRRLQQALSCQVYLSAPQARARVAAYLLRDLHPDDRDPEVARELTLKELGAVLGLAPETVCRVLGTFRDRGVIAMEPAAIRIRDADALRRTACV